jgi:hypothetical protein
MIMALYGRVTPVNVKKVKVKSEVLIIVSDKWTNFYKSLY